MMHIADILSENPYLKVMSLLKFVVLMYVCTLPSPP